MSVRTMPFDGVKQSSGLHHTELKPNTPDSSSISEEQTCTEYL